MKLGRRFPAAFFFFVLGGEDPIDHVQRQVLSSGREQHPLAERIMRIHVTEEARHIKFAREGVVRRTRVPEIAIEEIPGSSAAALVIRSGLLDRTASAPSTSR